MDTDIPKCSIAGCDKYCWFNKKNGKYSQACGIFHLKMIPRFKYYLPPDSQYDGHLDCPKDLRDVLHYHYYGGQCYECVSCQCFCEKNMFQNVQLEHVISCVN